METKRTLILKLKKGGSEFLRHIMRKKGLGKSDIFKISGEHLITNGRILKIQTLFRVRRHRKSWRAMITGFL